MKLEEQRLGGTITADGLQDLLLASADLNDFLKELARQVASGLSRDGRTVVCAVTVARPKRAATTGAGSPDVVELEQLQSQHREGPAITAMGEARTVYVRDLSSERRWPRFGQSAAMRGYFGILCVPIELDGGSDADSRAAVSFYARGRSGFTAGEIVTAEDVARQVSGPLRLSLRLGCLRDSRDELANAMQSRSVIDMAIGVIMAQNRCRPDEAFTVLRKASNARNTKVRDVAASIVASIAGTTDIHARFEL